jgi:hypothetical protein
VPLIRSIISTTFPETGNAKLLHVVPLFSEYSYLKSAEPPLLTVGERVKPIFPLPGNKVITNGAAGAVAAAAGVPLNNSDLSPEPILLTALILRAE